MNPIKYFETLPWDSKFFRFPVARINDEVDIFANKNILQSLFENNIRLAYYSSSRKLVIPESNLYEVKLVDKKVTYTKEIIDQKVSPKIMYYDKKFPEPKLISLAIESGIYSRFNVDERMGREKFEALYRQWIVKSVAKEIADEVLVYKINDEIAGFVTVGKKSNRADIGIIAVDNKYRGRGVGKALMLGAESLYKNKFNYIQVVTQKDNLPACKLYESCGYTRESLEYFYHIWQKEEQQI